MLVGGSLKLSLTRDVDSAPQLAAIPNELFTTKEWSAFAQDARHIMTQDSATGGGTTGGNVVSTV